MTKPLTESVLRPLTSEAFVTYLGQADQFECLLRPGCCSVTTGEPVADLNYIVAGHGATESGAFGAACATFISKRLPFLAILFPGAGPGPRRRLATGASSTSSISRSWFAKTPRSIPRGTTQSSCGGRSGPQRRRPMRRC